MLSDVSASNIDPLYGVADREAFEYRRAMAHTISAVEYDARCLTSGIETQDTLLLEENLGRAELLKEDVSRLNSIAEGVEWWLGQQDRVLLGRGLELVEHVSP